MISHLWIKFSFEVSIWSTNLGKTISELETLSKSSISKHTTDKTNCHNLNIYPPNSALKGALKCKYKVQEVYNNVNQINSNIKQERF